MGESSGDQGGKTMKFFLPAEYDSMEKIPKPTDPAVKIAEVPAQVGVVHRYSGSLSEQLHDEKAKALSAQLREDGIDRMTEEYVLHTINFGDSMRPSQFQCFVETKSGWN